MSYVVGGVDGCPVGWLLARTTRDSSQVGFHVYSRFEALLHENPDLDVIAVDIPIGLADSGARPTDSAARAFLGLRGSSVFPAPVRAALKATTYDEACAASFAAHGKKLSKQTFAILPKIREVDDIIRRDAAVASRVREIHPEVSFCTWNADRPMSHPKRTGLGFAERLSLVESRFPGAFEAARGSLRRKEAEDDDILDALAALWSAERIQRGVARCLPDGALQHDATGLPMAIWA